MPRWLALAALALAMFGNYYVFDALNPVAPFLERELGFTQTQIGLLDSSYNIAALLVLLAGGLVIDRAGTRTALLIFGVVTVLGGAIIALSPGVGGMTTGRFVLGVGAEPLIVAITTALAKWFKGRELSFAMGLNLAFGRLGSAAADTSQSWAGGLFTSWQPPLLLAAAISLTCVVGAVIYWGLEAAAERRGALGAASATDRLVVADLVRFDRVYWWIVGLCVTFYGAVFPFRRFANIFLTHAHGVSPEQAGELNGLLPFTAVFAIPIFGLVADKFGHRALLAMLGTLLLPPAFLMLAHTQVAVAVPMTLIGLAFSLVPAVMWPSVAYLVPESRLGTAYALMTFCQQAAWGAVASGIGRLNDLAGASAQNPAGYVPGLWLFAALGFIGLLFAWLLWRHETTQARSAAPIS